MAQTQRRYRRPEVWPFSVAMPARGLFHALPSLFIDPRYSPNLSNIRIYQGEVTNRPGIVNRPDPAETLDNIPLGGFLHQLPSGAVYTVVLTKTNLYYYKDAGPTFWTAQGGTLTSADDTDIPTFCNAFGKLYFANGNNLVNEWVDAGTGVAAQIATSYIGRYITSYANRLCLAYTKESGTDIIDRVRWCAIADDTQWSPAANATAGFTDLVDWPGEITGSRSFAGSNMIFQRNNIISMTESGLYVPSFFFNRVVEGVGTLSNGSITEAGGLLYFLGTDNVYTWDGSSPTPTPIGTPIINQLLDNLTRSHVRRIFSFYHETFKEYWLCVPTANATWPNVAYVYNTLEQSWTQSPFEGTCCVPQKLGGVSQVIDDVSDIIDDVLTTIDSSQTAADNRSSLVGRSDKKMYLIDDSSVTDNGVAVQAEFETADTDFNVEGTLNPFQHTVNNVHLTCRSRAKSTLYVEISTDHGKRWTALGNQTFARSSGAETLRFPARVTCKYARIRVMTTGPFALLGITYNLVDRGPFKGNFVASS